MMLIASTFNSVATPPLMSPSTCGQGTSLHTVTIMLREVCHAMMLIVDLSLTRVIQHSPFQFDAFAYRLSAKFSFRSYAIRVCTHVIDDHYPTHGSKFTLSSLK